MFPTSYGLFGSILSTDGMLSLDNSYVIGIPSTGQESGMQRAMNSSRVMFRECLRPETRLHSHFNGEALRLLRSASSRRSLLIRRYSRMYSRCCSAVFTPLARFRSILDADWHALQMFGSLPSRGVNSLSGFSIQHFLQRRTSIPYNVGLTANFTCKSCDDQVAYV